MRVLVDFRPALRTRTGVGEYLYNLVAALIRHREAPEVTLFSSSWKDRLRRADLEALSPTRVVDRRVPVRVLNLAWHRLGWPPAERLAAGRYDVAHSPHPLLIPSRQAARLVTIHDLDFLAHPERARAEIRRDYPALVRRHAHGADRILVSSRYAARQIERQLEVPLERISLVQPGAPAWPEPLREDRADGQGHILFIGTLESRKNVAGLLKAYAALLERVPKLPRLVLAGRAAPEAEPWLRSLREAPLAGHVEYRGYVEDEERPRLYAAAVLLVLPSFEEGFGMPVLEAMSQGVPVVASDRGALPEVLGDAGTLVNPEDDDALASAMEQLLTDEAFAAACAAKGRQRARQLTWSASADALLEAYHQAIETRRERAGVRGTKAEAVIRGDGE